MPPANSYVKVLICCSECDYARDERLWKVTALKWSVCCDKWEKKWSVYGGSQFSMTGVLIRGGN